LTPCFEEHGVYFNEAEIVFICRKIFHTDVDQSLFDDQDVYRGYYHDAHYHRVFIGEIEKVLRRA